MSKFRYFIKRLIAAGIYYSKLYKFFNPPLSFIMYHKIGDNGKLSISKRTFEKHLKYFKKNYKIISLNTFISKIKNDIPIPNKAIVLTFDDGFEDTLRNVYPLLKKYEIRASLFIKTDYINLKGYLTWKQIKKMRDRFSFEAHTITHPDLSKLSLANIKREILGSKKIIEKNTGKKVKSFAFPKGKVKNIPKLKELIIQNFDCAFAGKAESKILKDWEIRYKLFRIDAIEHKNISYLNSKILRLFN